MNLKLSIDTIETIVTIETNYLSNRYTVQSIDQKLTNKSQTMTNGLT